jgi:hypothetical protein
MVIITGLVAAAVVIALGLLLYRANGSRVNRRQDLSTAKSSMEDEKHRATGIN